MTSEEFIPGVESHETLNPLLWDEHEHLRPEVRKGLMRMAHEFFDFLEIPVSIIDIIVTGSQANYHYTPHSDLDLHVIVPYGDVKCDQSVDELFNTKRKLWKLQHTIAVHGIPVECYAEDEKTPVKGSAYSVIHNEWIRRATKQDEELPSDVERSASAWTRVITAAIKARSPEQLELIKEMLFKYRKLGLAQSGEFNRANVVFKMLRNSGVIADLMEAIRVFQDKDLSVQD